MPQNVLDALTAGDTAQALHLAQQAVAADPDAADAQHALGLVLHAGGDLDAAAKALDRAIELDPQNARFHMARASLALGQGEIDRAQSALGRAVEADPNRLSAYVFGAQLALARGDADGAEAQWKLASRVAPEHPIVTAMEGNIAALRGDQPRAEALLAAAAKAAPDDALIIASLGLAYLRGSHHAFAEAALRRALELNPAQKQLRWALIEAVARQDQQSRVVEELKLWLQDRPGDPRALTLLGETLLRLGLRDEAVAAFRELFRLRPLRQKTFDQLTQFLANGGEDALARELVEEQLALDPASEFLWLRRIALAAGNSADIESTLTRWRNHNPDNAIQRGISAQAAEARGDDVFAESEADAALALDATLLGALQVKFRTLLLRDPTAALALAEQVLADAQGEGGRRAALAWRGLALDALGRSGEAAEAWKAASQIVDPGAILPSAHPLAAIGSAIDAPVARLLWGPPGSRVIELVELLRPLEGIRLLTDRFGQHPRADGLGPLREDGRAFNTRGWRGNLERAGIDPQQALDWLPLWDGRIEQALPGALLIAVIADPRDLLVNSVVYGGPQPWPVLASAPMAAWLAEALEPLAQRIERDPRQTLLVQATDLFEQPQAVLDTVCTALGLSARPDTSALGALRQTPNGVPVCLAPGRWREFAGAFADEFAVLAPIAARLGYTD